MNTCGLEEQYEQALRYYCAVTYNICRQRGMLSHYDDAMQEARLALWKFRSVWDFARNDNFIKAAYLRVNGAVIDYFRANGYYDRSSGKSTVSVENHPSLVNSIAAPSEPENYGDALPPDWQAFLRPRERLIFSMYFVDGMTLRSIGNEIGINKNRVSQIMSDALKRLRKDLGEIPW